MNKSYNKQKKIVELYQLHLENDHKFRSNVQEIKKILSLMLKNEKRKK